MLRIYVHGREAAILTGTTQWDDLCPVLDKPDRYVEIHDEVNHKRYAIPVRSIRMVEEDTR